jgi:dihydroneopterin aldolase
MMTIHLEELRFYGYHGLYVQEKKLGAWFELDIILDWPTGLEEPIVRLQETVNYAAVYEVVKLRMSEPTELLETLAMDLVYLLKEQFPELIALRIRVRKMNPPLPNFQGKVSVEYSKKF